MQIEWNKVTWYSKAVAVVLFVGTFLLGLYLGSEYQKSISAPTLGEEIIPDSNKPQKEKETRSENPAKTEENVSSQKSLTQTTEKKVGLTTYVDKGYGYSFTYPSAWVLDGFGTELDIVNAETKDDHYFQLYNFDNSNAPPKDGCCGGDGKNKIEGGRIIGPGELPDRTLYTQEYIGGKKVYHKEINDEMGDIASLLIPVPNKTDTFVIISIYGDSKEFKSIIETILADFTFF